MARKYFGTDGIRGRVGDHPVTAEEIREFCKTHLSAFKIPRYIWVMQEPLPRNASGKFVKRELQESLLVADAG